MATKTISIPLDAETAKAYESAPADEKKKIGALVSLWLRDLAKTGPGALGAVLDETARKARARGLTPELLESLLKGA
jgi:hypothetical protein